MRPAFIFTNFLQKLSQESVETDVIFRDDSKIIQIARCDIFH